MIPKHVKHVKLKHGLVINFFTNVASNYLSKVLLTFISQLAGFAHLLGCPKIVLDHVDVYLCNILACTIVLN